MFPIPYNCAKLQFTITLSHYIVIKKTMQLKEIQYAFVHNDNQNKIPFYLPNYKN